MIKKYQFGSPFNTEAVAALPKNTPCFNDDFKIPYGNLSSVKNEDKSETLSFTLPLLPEDRIFGLGETTGGINKRGHIYRSWCTDDPNHTEEKEALYGAHNFILVHSPKKDTAFALFIDFPGLVTWDPGVTKSDLLTITVSGTDADFYFFEPDSIDRFRNFNISGPFIPKDDRQKLCSSTLGTGLHAEPVGLRNRKRPGQGLRKSQETGNSSGCNLSGYRLYGRFQGFYR